MHAYTYVSAHEISLLLEMLYNLSKFQKSTAPYIMYYLWSHEVDLYEMLSSPVQTMILSTCRLPALQMCRLVRTVLQSTYSWHQDVQFTHLVSTATTTRFIQQLSRSNSCCQQVKESWRRFLECKSRSPRCIQLSTPATMM